ncbi:MAG: hypothetical protein CL663_01015 [Bacteroidetes bacterium]|nr:hypothetical protein [Bacteroidota bacterium]|tara:strand:+ start:99 stop:521 length:423 start_codon:yes stop_codon:yes gene_type:complete
MKPLNSVTQNILKTCMLIFVIWAVASCSKDETPDQGTGGGNSGGSACDLSNVTFSETVWPIINANCTSCHSGASPGGGILLTNHATVAAQGAIGSGNPGSLLGAITHAAGNSPMPQGQAKLSDCNISKIRTWINAGMPDN